MKKARSFLFVPADSQKKILKAKDIGADAVILDLEDSVAPSAKPTGRAMAAAALKEDWPCQVWVRINPLTAGMVEADLEVLKGDLPTGVILPKAQGPQDVAALSRLLDEFDPDGHIHILPIVTETAAAPFTLANYIGADLPRLWGMTWGAEDLATDIGASQNKDGQGNWLPVFESARTWTLLAAKAAGVEAIDTLHADFRDADGLRARSDLSRREGFNGRLAIHPAQVAVINDAYLPSPDAVSHARRVVEAFAASPGAGVVGLDGKMVDIPHLKQAQAILEAAHAFGVDEGA